MSRTCALTPRDSWSAPNPIAGNRGASAVGRLSKKEGMFRVPSGGVKFGDVAP
jgi:hypothetical protein